MIDLLMNSFLYLHFPHFSIPTLSTKLYSQNTFTKLYTQSYTFQEIPPKLCQQNAINTVGLLMLTF